MGAIKRMAIRKQRKLKPVGPMSHSAGVGEVGLQDASTFWTQEMVG